MIRKLITATLVGTAVLSLTACDPPLPPEVRTAIMEQNVTCESGEVTVSGTYLLSGFGYYLADTLPIDCEELIVSGTEDDPTADIQISYLTPEEQGDKEEVPVALDAAVFVTNLVDLGSLVFSQATIEGIIAGEITKWNDPAIASDNPFETLPELPITLITEAEPHVIRAFESWMTNLTGEAFVSGFTAVSGFDYYQIMDAEEGALGLISFVDNFDAYMLQAGFRYGVGQDDFVVADLKSLASAGSQLDYVKVGNGIDVEMDYSREPEAPAGSDVAPAPYQALSPVYLSYDPAAELAVRATGFYALRQDSQGAFEQFSVSQLPEHVRIEAGTVVATGLPQPELTAEQLQQLGLD